MFPRYCSRRDRFRSGRGQNAEFALKDAAAAIIGHLGMIGEATISDKQRGKSGTCIWSLRQDFEVYAVVIVVIGLTLRQWRGLLKATDKAQEIKSLEQNLGLSLDDEGHRWENRYEINNVFRSGLQSERLLTLRTILMNLVLPGHVSEQRKKHLLRTQIHFR